MGVTTQRLLDPMPAGNCKLQTPRQYYRLPERGAHTALGDVGTVADLFAMVLRPIAEPRGLATWEQLAAYAAEQWVPSRIAFGKYKGRSIHFMLTVVVSPNLTRNGHFSCVTPRQSGPGTALVHRELYRRQFLNARCGGRASDCFVRRP
jgi:hypothetical protein